MIVLFSSALIATCLWMVATWGFAVRKNNFGVVDAAWCFSFTGHAIYFAAMGEGDQMRRLLVLGLLGFWSLRLGIYLARRIASHHPEEDTRYKALRAEYGANLKTRFLIFFELQAFSVSFLSFGFLWVAMNPDPQIHPLEWAGVAVAILAVLGEGLADYQMSKFRKDPANKGGICEVGLWKYSRHPNYFFESGIWWGFYIFFLGTSGAWFLVYAPLTILFLLLKVTGVPPTEKQSLQSRGQKYVDYQNRVSVFVPWFPKRKSV